MSVRAGQLQSALKGIRKAITKTVSAFANSNREGGLLVLGIASNGEVTGVEHLAEKDKNGITGFGSLLRNQAATARYVHLPDSRGASREVCLVFVPFVPNAICETPSSHPKAWQRNGPQSISLTQEARDRLRIEKGLLNFELTLCCPFDPTDVDQDVLGEFKRVSPANATQQFSDRRILYEVGAVARHSDGSYWFTNAGVLFFASNPQRLFPGSHIRVLRFATSADNQSRRGLPTFERQFQGPLTRQIRQARTFFRESAFFKRYQKRRPTGGFVEEPELPFTVIDEAVVNAVVHRDYQTQLPIECEHYEDVFLVRNPGRMSQRSSDLPESFSLSDVILDSTPRNAKLLEWLKSMSDSEGNTYVQALSEGTKQMLEEMTKLGLPSPQYKLSENQTSIRLESNAQAREAAILAASRAKSVEFGNLFPLQVRREDQPVNHAILANRYRQLVETFRAALIGSGWYIDRLSHSRITAHIRGAELSLPPQVRDIVRFYPAYEFQFRQYNDILYLCLDYRCLALNVLSLTEIRKVATDERLEGGRCVAKQEGQWLEGRLMSLGEELTRIRFVSTGMEGLVQNAWIIPYCSLATIEASLQRSSVVFDLHGTLKRYSLAVRSNGARLRWDKITDIIEYVSERVFPIQVGDLEIDVSQDPIELVHDGGASRSFSVQRLSEPEVEFGAHRATIDVRAGIMKFGAFDDRRHRIEIVPICQRSRRPEMERLIQRLKTGAQKYLGSERTFRTQLSHSTVVTVEAVEDIIQEVRRLLEENKEWRGDRQLRRVFLVHTPKEGYAKDDHDAPYYVVKRYLLEQGIPSQMVDTSTLQDATWKDLNLALNMVAKCGVRPWVLPDKVPDADFFVGISYTQSRDGRRIMGFANVFNCFGRWEFYSGNTSFFDFEQRRHHLARVVKKAIGRLGGRLSDIPRIVFHHSAKLSRNDKAAIVVAARAIRPRGTYTFVWINRHHNVRFFDRRPQTDGSLRRGSYVVVGNKKIYLSTTGDNQFRRLAGTAKPLEVSAWTEMPSRGNSSGVDLRSIATQVHSLTKLNWASTDAFCGEPITLKYAREIAYLTSAFLRRREPFVLHRSLETTPWFI